MFTICVFDESTGRPASGKRVSVEIKEGIFDFGFLPDQYTDSRGEAHFDHDNARGVVYVGGRSMHEGYLSGRIRIYI